MSPQPNPAVAALAEIIDLYNAADADTTTEPLSGADVVDELGMWIERHQSLLAKLGLLADVGTCPE